MPVPLPLLVLMKEDSRAIFTAASRVKGAVTFLKRFEPFGIRFASAFSSLRSYLNATQDMYLCNQECYGPRIAG